MTNRHKNIFYFEQSYLLKKIRGDLTQKVFANKLGVPLRSYVRYENGTRNMPNGLFKLALIFNENNGKIVLEDEALSLNENGKAIKEYLDNFKMELEVVYGPNDPRRSAGAKLYNIAPSNTSAPSNSSKPPAADPWQETLDMARQVLESGTDHAGSLASTIKLSFNTIQDKKRLEAEYHRISNELETIKQLSTGRGKVEDSDAAQAVGS